MKKIITLSTLLLVSTLSLAQYGYRSQLQDDFYRETERQQAQMEQQRAQAAREWERQASEIQRRWERQQDEQRRQWERENDRRRNDRDR